MDEVVNAFQLAMADQDCYDEAIQYSCTNNYLTYSDSSGNYGQVIADGEFWSPDGSGRATTITFNPEYGPNNQIIYDLSKGIVNDMTYGNGSVAQDRVMEGALIENNQCYFSNLTQTYNMVRQSVGSDVITTSQTYRNSSFTIFIKFSQKDSTTVADVDGSFNGTNLYEGAVASKGSGTINYDNNGDAITSVATPGTTESNYTSTDLQGSGSLTPDYKLNNDTQIDSYNPNDPKLNPDDGIKLKNGDTYTYGDYIYQFYDWSGRDGQIGWMVSVVDKTKTEYGPIFETLHGYPILRLAGTFSGCENMTNAPTIPSGVIYMSGAFSNCKSLVEAPDMSHVINVDSMNEAFYSCSSLKYVHTLPQKSSNMEYAFRCCYNLISVPNALPQGVTNIQYLFAECYSLQNIPTLPNTITYMNGAFAHCRAIKAAPPVPSSVTHMNDAFYGCSSLTTPPNLSNANNLQEMANAFGACTSLKTAPVIPNGVTNMRQTFYQCTSLTSPPILPSTVKDIYGIFQECTSLSKAPVIPSSVYDMGQSFYNCTSLTGNVEINAKIASKRYSKCFYNVDFSSQNIHFTGSSVDIDNIGATGQNYCAECNGKCNGSH